MSHLPRFHVNGEIFYGPGAFGPVVLTNPDPRFPPRQRAQEVQSTAPAPSAQHPPTRPVAAARQMPPPSAIFHSDSPSRRPVAQSMALTSPPADLLPLPASAFPSQPQPLRPPCQRPRRRATDGRLRAPHAQSHSITVVPIVIPFAPTHGPGLEGVAMTERSRPRRVGSRHADCGLDTTTCTPSTVPHAYPRRSRPIRPARGLRQADCARRAFLY
ncbi:hypothetical protein GGX14DRAFT_384068 [Mycena pura]|uniref:Uncharacterized protein n=1 Tax=Mycena pura TaxID=153505 RepID=A0AAD6YUK8_9AGAR|nr:hypothetical protein GGX14DRAFT_384068 [Mycena pura]